MKLTVIASHAILVKAINNFNDKYQKDYFSVRFLADSYLSSPAIAENAVPLAKKLHEVLFKWGVCKRRAPKIKSIAELTEVLLNSDFHALLNGFISTPVSKLRIKNEIRTVCDVEAGSNLDKNLNLVLSKISTEFLIKNTNVTYPMKVLLLLTGFMPALDSRVRNGLKKAGISGVGSAQFLMPTSLISIESRKLTRLPFILGECFFEKNNNQLLMNAINASNYRGLAKEPGRLFDILFFMQGLHGEMLLGFKPTVRHWYDLE